MFREKGGQYSKEKRDEKTNFHIAIHPSGPLQRRRVQRPNGSKSRRGKFSNLNEQSVQFSMRKSTGDHRRKLK